MLNYGHPLTAAQVAELARLVGAVPTVRVIDVQVDRARPLEDVARDLADAAGLTGEEWQTVPLIVNPPGLAPLALALIAELHGRCGYFVPVLNVRPVDGALAPHFELAEVVNLQRLRESARVRRR